MILALALCLSAAAILAWLVFALAAHALPTLIGAAAAYLVYRSGAGVAGALVTGMVIGALTYAAAVVAIERSRSPALRLGLLALHAAPAGLLGFSLVHGVAERLVPSPAWQAGFAAFAGLWVAATACARVTTFAPPGGPDAAGRADLARP